MNYRTVFKISILFFLIITIIFIFSGIKPKSKVEELFKFEADGMGMIHETYNEKDKKILEIECSESKSESSDKTLMKNIRATIFKKGKMTEDLKISGSEGFVENNFTFFLF